MVRRMWQTTVSVTLGVAVLFGAATTASGATPTRYSLAGGCYAIKGAGGQPVPGAERVPHAGDDARQLPALPPGPHVPGRSSERTPSRPPPSRARRPTGASRTPGGERSPRAARRASDAVGACALRPGRRLRRLPRGRAQRHRHAGEGRDALRRGRRPGRGPHALDDLRVLRRQLPLRPAVAPVRHPVRAARLRRRSRARRAPRAPLQNILNYGNPAAAARHARLPEAHRVGRATTSPTRAPTGAGSSAPGSAACG